MYVLLCTAGEYPKVFSSMRAQLDREKKGKFQTVYETPHEQACLHVCMYYYVLRMYYYVCWYVRSMYYLR